MQHSLWLHQCITDGYLWWHEGSCYEIHHQSLSQWPVLLWWADRNFWGDVISKLTGLSNKGDPVPVGIKEGLVEELTGSPSRKNSKGLMISQITTWTPQIVAKIIAITLTLAGRGNNLKLEMLEAVDTIATDRWLYRWGNYVANMVKTICERCQEMGGIIKFPSLILWIVMYHICPKGSPIFQEPSRFDMWRFKPFSKKEPCTK